MKKCVKTIVSSAVVLAPASFLTAAVFNGGALTQAKFDQLQKQAGPNGTIEIKGTATTSDPLRVTQKGLTIIGKTAGSTISLTCKDKSVSPPRNVSDDNTVPSNVYTKADAKRAVFIVGANDIKFSNLIIKGQYTPLLKQNVAKEEGARVVVGVESGIATTERGILNLSVKGCQFRNVNVGISYASGGLPHGLNVTNTKFYTGRGAINCVEGRSGASVVANRLSLTKKMVLSNADIFRTNAPKKNFFSARGFTFDFGNGPHNYPVNNVPAVNFLGSTVTGCNVNGISFLGIDFNRCKNITIGGTGADANVFRIGNFGLFSYGGIHFEAGSSDITCRNNTIINDKVGGVITNGACSYFGGIGGMSYHPPHHIKFIGNKHQGYVQTFFRHTYTNWTFTDEIIATGTTVAQKRLGDSLLTKVVAKLSFTGSNNHFNKGSWEGDSDVKFGTRTVQSIASDKKKAKSGK